MIYFLAGERCKLVKIGHTSADTPTARLHTLQTGSPDRLVLLGTMHGTREDEQRLHRRFRDARVHGEWFRPTPPLVRCIRAADRTHVTAAVDALALAEAEAVQDDDAGVPWPMRYGTTLVHRYATALHAMADLVELDPAEVGP